MRRDINSFKKVIPQPERLFGAQKHFTLYLFFFCLIGISNLTFGQTESEPNDDTSTADAIAFSSTASGSITPAGDEDYWQLTTTANGKITVNFASANGIPMIVRLYSSDLSTTLASGSTSSNANIYKDGLSAGTYYVQVKGYSASNTPTYTLSPSFTSIAQANDIEPNNVAAEAQSFALNGSTTGHIGYREFNENEADSQDWFVVTTNADGKLELTLTSHNGQPISYRLYDGDGSTSLANGSTSSSTTISEDGLAPGNYFVKVTGYAAYNFTPYTLSNNLVLPAHATEGSGNDTYETAQTLNLNASVNGHIGYRYNGDVDMEDWFAIAVDTEGELQVDLTVLNSQPISYRIYDGDGTTSLTSGSTSSTTTISKDGLAPGTYFVKINGYSAYNFGPYILENTLNEPPHPTEGSDNDDYLNAQVLNLNSSVNGLIGYRYNGDIDLNDWYSVTTDANGKIQLNLSSLNSQPFSYRLYDGNGTTLLTNGSTSSSTSIERDGLAAGEYFVKVTGYAAFNFGPYTLENQLILPDTPDDANDDANDNATGANELVLNEPNYGHIGYRYNSDVDFYDWYTFQWSEIQDLDLKLKVYNSQPIAIRLYQADGTTQITSTSTSSETSLSVNNLPPGNYYLKVGPYASYNFAPYRINTGIDTDDDGYADAIDCEPNDATIWREGTFYIDMDGDGYHGTSEVICHGDETPSGYSENTLGLDCDDENAAINPGAEEICDGIDNNCDGNIDEGVANTYYQDADGDGFGNAAVSMMACEKPVGYVVDNTDCDDTNADINPDATEIPGNGIDENCDGVDEQLPDSDGDDVADADDNCPNTANTDQADMDNDGIGDACDDDIDGDGIINSEDCDPLDSNVGAGTTFYQDADGDGYGNAAVSMTACEQPAGYVVDNTDCDDTNADINPGATEIPGNGIDENCDGADEQLPDSDGDGVADVDDNCPNIANADQADMDNDGIGDACDDDIDGDGIINSEDCDPLDSNVGVGTTFYQDADGDGYGNAAVSMMACEQPAGYVVDNTDCDDTDATIYPGAVEIANDGIDQDCDGEDLVETEECPAPSNIQFTSTTSTISGSLTENGTATMYDLATATINNHYQVNFDHPVFQNIPAPFTHRGMSPGQTYVMWVRADCSGDDTLVSDWVGPFYPETLATTVRAVPNPTTGLVKFEGTTIQSIQVFDAYGKLVLQQAIKENQALLHGLNTGTYTIHAMDKNHKWHQLQVIKK